jgi:electron transfer flavoprotein alpha/beta subunit
LPNFPLFHRKEKLKEKTERGIERKTSILLRLFACFKTTWNLDEVTAEEWNRLESGQSLLFMKKTLGMYDESALELALRLSDDAKALGRETELTALTIGEDLEDPLAKNLFAIGYARVVHVTCTEDLRFRPDLAAGMICGFIEKAGGKSAFDLILTGQQANPGDNGQTHLLTAEKLGIPCVLNVIDASCAEGGVYTASLVDGGVLEQTLTAPAVLGIGNAAHPYLRVSTLRERMAASQKNVLLIPGESLLPPDERGFPKVIQTSLALKKVQRQCRFVQGGSAEEKARSLYDSCLKDVLRS